MKVNVVITTWNALEYTKITISSLFSATKTPFYLTIVDNNSEKETVDYIKSLEPTSFCQGITKIFNSKNLGPARAFNQGFKISQKNNAQFTCICNNDLFFQENWLENLLNEFQDGEIAAVAPMGISAHTKHFNGKRNSRQVFENIDKNLSPKEEISAFFEGKIAENMTKFLSKNKEKILSSPPSFAPSHCLIIRNSDAQKIGLIADPIYKKYGADDVDFSWEIFKIGKKIKISNRAFVYHFRHKSISENNLNRRKLLAENTKIFTKKWQNEIKKLQSEPDFFEKFFDLENEDFSILRKMNEKTNFIGEKTQIFAVFGALGKTTFAEKYPHLSVDLETSKFRYFYKNSVEIEAQKGQKGRELNPDFPQNYLQEIGKFYGKKGIIFIALSPEIMKTLNSLGIKFSVIYPDFEMKKEILSRAKNRGNSLDFIKKLEKNLSSLAELEAIKNLKPKRIIFAKNNDTVESILARDEEIQNIHLENSSFEYKGVKYDVVFNGLINKKIPDVKWSQVYVVGKINGKVPIVKYNKKGRISFNLPGGGTEAGESFEETLRREVLEELNMSVVNFEPIGHQINLGNDGSEFHQLRVFAELEKNGDFIKDIGGSVIGYELTEINNLNSQINWGEVGDWFMLTLQDKYEE